MCLVGGGCVLVSDGNNKITKRLAEKGVTKKLAGEIGKMVYEIGGKERN